MCRKASRHCNGCVVLDPRQVEAEERCRMTNNANGNGQKRGSSGLIDTVNQLIKKIAEVSTSLKGKVELGHIALAGVVSVAFTAGGVSWNYIRPGEPSKDIGIIYNAEVASFPTPKKFPHHSGEPYAVRITFAKDDCRDTAAKKSMPCVDALTGGDVDSCSATTGKCSALLVNIDEGQKTNSSTIDYELHRCTNKDVEIVFSGKRDSGKSDFPNVLLVGPSSNCSPWSDSPPADSPPVDSPPASSPPASP